MPPAIQPAVQSQAFLLVLGLDAPGWQADPPRLFSQANDRVVAGNGGPDEGLLPDAGMLRELGLKDFVKTNFRRPQRSAGVEVFEFRDGAGAFAAYSCMRQGASTVVVRGDASSEDDNSICFWQGRFFVRLTVSAEEDDPSKSLIRSLADQLSQGIKDHSGLPQVVQRLPVADRLAGSEKFFLGPLAARKFNAAPNSNILLIERSAGAAFADYQFPRPDPERMKLLLVDYGEPSLARNVYTQYVASLANNHKAEVLSPDAQMFKMSSNSYLLCRLRATTLAIVSGARKKLSAVMLDRVVR
jgi:hypothetical protein